MMGGTGSTASENPEPLSVYFRTGVSVTRGSVLLGSSHSASQSMSMVSEIASVVLEDRSRVLWD